MKNKHGQMLGCLDKYSSFAPLFLRLVLGIVFIAHGYGKLWGSAPGMENWIGMLTGLGVPLPLFFAYLVAIIEFFGGIALLIGWRTRCTSILISLVMIFAIFLVKINLGFFGGMELDIALLGAALSLLFSGAGPWSSDAMCMEKKKTKHKRK